MIEYSDTQPTHQDVTAALKMFRSDGSDYPADMVTITNNNGSHQYTFSQNGSFTFEYETVNGLTGTAQASVTWIDKEAPSVPTVEYSTTQPTGGNVTVTFSFADPGETIVADDPNEAFINVVEANKKYEFTGNGSHTFIFRDLAGNSVSQVVTVDWIDKTGITGDITYSTTRAAMRVTATLTASKDNCQVYNEASDQWENLVNRTAAYLFEANGAHTFRIRDSVGHETSFTAEVTWIADSNIVPRIIYSPEQLTQTDVEAQLTFVNQDTGEPPVIRPYDCPQPYFTFEDNGVHTFTYTDLDGTSYSIDAEVDWIDKTPPTADVSYSPSINTTGSVRAVVTAVDDRGGTVTFTQPDGTNEYTFTENGSYIFVFEDEAGNSDSIVATVNWIQEACVPVVAYSSESPTRDSVTARITFPGWTGMEIINNDGQDTYTFTNNGKFSFQYRDPDGNEGSADAEVTWIDREAPTAQFSYIPSNKTAGNVTVEIEPADNCSAADHIQIVNNNGATAYTFTDNGTFDFIIADEAGNQATVTAAVNWIDRQVTEDVHIEYSTTDFTNSNVTAKAVFGSLDEDIYFDDPSGDTYIFSKNGTHTFNYADALGNKASVTAAVDWIDKTPPQMEISYSKETLTNENVVVTINGTDGPADADYARSGLDAFAWSKTRSGDYVTFAGQGEGQYTLTFSDNGSVEAVLTDKAGNETKETIQVDWIERDVPAAEVQYSPLVPTNDMVQVTISLTDAHATTITNADQLPDFIQPDVNNDYALHVGAAFIFYFTENGSYTFDFTDAAGNTGSVAAAVTNIDREAPEVEINYSTEESTPYEVTACLRTKNPEKITGVNEEAAAVYGDDGTLLYYQLAHTFYVNGVYTFAYQDVLGNTGQAAARVDWIENRAPDVTIEYSGRYYTQKPVEVRLILKNDYLKGFHISNNNGADTYTFTDSGTFTFEFQNDYGAKGEITAAVDWIDKTPPTVDHIEYVPGGSQPKPTHLSTNILIYTKDDGSGPMPVWGHIVRENGDYEFEISDQAGNKAVVPVTVDWIDRTPPDLKWAGDFATVTHSDLTVTLSAGEKFTVLIYNMPYERNSGASILVDQESSLLDRHTVVLTKNGIYRVTCMDEAGNIAKTEIEVTNIDKEAPVLSSTANEVIVMQAGDKANITRLLGMKADDNRDGDLTAKIDYVLASSEISPNGDETRVYECSVKDSAGNQSETVSRTVIISAQNSPTFYVDGQAAGDRVTVNLTEGQTTGSIALAAAGFYGDYVLRIASGEKPAAFFKSARTSSIFYSSRYSVGELKPLALEPGIYTVYGHDMETGYVTLVIEVKGGE